MANEYAPGVDEREGLEAYDQWLGLRNNVDEESFARGDLSVALNVDIDDSLGIGRRKGYSAPVTANVDRDLWASGAVCLGVGSNALKLINPDYSTVTLRTGLTPSRPVSYAAVGGRVFYANGAEIGCVDSGTHRTWGIAVPGVFTLAAGSGALAAGKYQVTVSYLRDDLQESGAARAQTIELADIGGLSLSAIPVSTDPTVTYKAIYCTSVGGQTLYRVGVIPNSQTTFLIDEIRTGASPLLTQFLQPPLAGDHIGYTPGYMLVAVGNRLYPSEHYAPELFDYRRSIPFLDVINMIAPVDGGVWIGTDNQIVWVAGETPEQWVYKTRAEYGVVPGALAFADGEILGDGAQAGEIIACFASKRGLCVGLPGGRLINLTAARFAYPIQERGAAVVRKHRGINQMLVTMKGAEVAGNIAA